MNIGIFLGDAPMRFIGGGYTFVYAFLEVLKKCNTKHKFYVFYYNNGEFFTDSENVKFIPMTKIPRYYKFLFIKIRRKKNNLDSYFNSYQIDTLYAISPIFFKSDLPSFVTIWDFGHKDIIFFPEVFAKGEFDYREGLYLTLINRASKVIVSNSYAKAQLLTYYNIDEKKVVINPLPTPDYILNLTPDDTILDKFYLKKNEFIFYPAQFWAHKNHIRILKALRLLKEKGIKIKVVFSGADHGNLLYIKTQVELLGLQDLVIFMGFISSEQVIALYKNCLSLVYASLLGPDNLPPLEAMALRCPAIVSGIEGHKVQLKDCCLYFDPTNEIDLATQIESIITYGYSSKLLNKGYDLAISNSMERYIDLILKEFDKFEDVVECYKGVK